MGTVSWLHLSDWHHKYPITGDRKKKRNKLLKDIKNLTDDIGAFDFILFSGDITNSGAREEFDEVKVELIDPIRSHACPGVPVYCVPGNHDIQRGIIACIADHLKNEIANLTSADAWRKFNDTVNDRAAATELNKPFSNYFDFLDSLGCENDRSKLHGAQIIDRHGLKIGLMCINTAWNSARFNLQHVEPAAGAKSWLWDYGLLRITEAQLQNAVDDIGTVDLGILMMHHPLHWIEEFERAKLEHMLFNSCHIVIHGHEHRPNTSRISSAFGDLVFIPAGATYAAASPHDPNYTSAYNVTTVDTATFIGTVHHRIWEEVQSQWKEDERFWAEGRSEFVLARKRDYDRKLAHKAIINANKQYIRSIGRRAVKDYQISIRHDPEVVDGEAFIKQRVKIKVLLRGGPEEDFLWVTEIDDMIADHPNEKVRSRGYRKLNGSAGLTSRNAAGDKNCIFKWGCRINNKEQWIEYEYEKLDLPNNYYFFQLSRFTDRVKLTLRPAQGYRYTYQAVGGFPSKEPEKDEILSIDTLETNEMILPSQGYIIQWRPDHEKVGKLKPDSGQKARRSRHVGRAPARRSA